MSLTAMQASKSMKKIPPQSTNVHYFTLESSSSAAPCAHSSPSTTSLSSANDSHGSHQDSCSDHAYESPLNSSSITEDLHDLKLNVNYFESFDTHKLLTDTPGDLKETLIACARAVEDDDILTAEWLMAEARRMVSVSGEPIQRLGAYLLEGLVARLSSSGSVIYRALMSKEPVCFDPLILYEACPYYKFGYMAANGAIADAVKNEERVHIIDFQMEQGSQWVTLIQALAMRPGGPPRLRITRINDGSVSSSAAAAAGGGGGGGGIVGQQLTRLAESCDIPFEFHSASAINGRESELENLGIRPGEAVAVNFAFQLHRVPDESVSTSNRRDRLLRTVKSLAPKVVTLVEQESNANTAAFFPRFLEALDYYAAVFDSIDASLPRESRERVGVEQHCLARDIVNVIACEGDERVERHEVHGKWKSRFRMAGFAPYPLSSLVNSTIRALLERYCEKYRVEERDGALYLGWMNRALVVSSAWR